MILALGNLVIGLVVVAVVIVFTNNSNQSLPQELSKLKKTKQVKLLELSNLRKQLKISEIDLVTNIDEVKRFISIHGQNTTLNKVKTNKRGIEYLLSGKSIDVLILLYKAVKQKLKIDITALGFQQPDKLIAEINIVGAEQ